MNKDKIYDIIFWMSMLIMIVWIILKIAGIINSPVWIEMIPYMSIVFAAGAFYQSINNAKLDMADLKIRMGAVELKFHDLEKEMVSVKTTFKHFNSDLNNLKIS
ncbi:hypothetical protein KY304_00190 [Candidatus Woesearchaeota archaeon]|nr:hypothetical protein [Candidatus Woesearchaeota archaeon]MBW2978515.1 hypothetical protein [Candidatus Woesearchaeota archaeon]